MIHARCLDHLNMKAEGVIAAMRDGAVLYRLHQPNSTLWMLSTGRRVNAEVARMVIVRNDIVGVGDCLFGSERSQTFRYIGMGAFMSASSRWKPSGEGLAPPIPEFLSRVTATAGRPSSTPVMSSPEKDLSCLSPRCAT